MENVILKRACLILATFLLLAASLHASAKELAIIVHSDNNVETMSEAQIKQYYLKKQIIWSNGEKVRPVDRKELDDLKTHFLEKILNMTNEDFERHWIEKQYANGQRPPVRAGDDADVIKFVQRFKGGIGVVDKSSLSEGSGVKAIFVVNY